MTSLAVLAILLASQYLIWRLVREYIVRSPLDNLPGPQPESLLTGNMGALFDRIRGWEFNSLLRKNGPVALLRGPLGSRVLYIYDTRAIQHVTQNEGLYSEPSFQLATNIMFFGPGLVSLEGHRHRKQRKLVLPVFSGNNLRGITPMFYRVAHKLRESISLQIQQNKQEVDVLQWMSRAALELIAQGGFGYSFDTMDVNHGARNDVCEAAKEAMPALFDMTSWRMLSCYIIRLGSPQFRRMLTNRIPHKGLQGLKWISDVLHNAAVRIVQEKKVSIEKQDAVTMNELGDGQDILSVLMKANMDQSDADRLSDDEILAQIGTIIFAGTDTTSNALARIFQRLAMQPEVQARLRRELAEAHNVADGDIDYDTLMELPFLDAVCRETLRLDAPVNMLFRETTKDVVMPLSKPVQGVNGLPVTEIPIPKNTFVVVSILDANRNEELWGPDALEWKPERWLSPLPSAVLDARLPGIYSNLMTFGGGTHSCIGFRFSQLEMKVILAVMLKAFRFSLTDKKIVWNISGVNFPTMADGTACSMILNVDAISD